MIVFPNAKINIGLNITAKRPDSFHNLETVFYPIKLTDILEIIPQNINVSSANNCIFKTTGIPIPGKKNENICIKAWSVMQKQFSLPPSSIHLHKVIPPGSGLGGGSSDAAHVIKLTNELYGLNLKTGDLKDIASGIGSDCAFFVLNEPVFATGKGDQFQEIEVNLKGFYLRLIFPGFQVSTRFAYSAVKPGKPEQTLLETIKLPVEQWKNNVGNDFEKTVFQMYPELKKIKESLYLSGAIYASMSGSGSAVYGIYKDRPETINLPSRYFIWEEKI